MEGVFKEYPVGIRGVRSWGGWGKAVGKKEAPGARAFRGGLDGISSKVHQLMGLHRASAARIRAAAPSFAHRGRLGAAILRGWLQTAASFSKPLPRRSPQRSQRTRLSTRGRRAARGPAARSPTGSAGGGVARHWLASAVALWNDEVFILPQDPVNGLTFAPCPVSWRGEDPHALQRLLQCRC